MTDVQALGQTPKTAWRNDAPFSRPAPTLQLLRPEQWSEALPSLSHTSGAIAVLLDGRSLGPGQRSQGDPGLQEEDMDASCT